MTGDEDIILPVGTRPLIAIRCSSLAKPEINPQELNLIIEVVWT